MGSWGTALYSNDTSSDVRDMCNEVYPLVGIEEGTKLILKEYTDVAESDVTDNECVDFWFALADWQWKHGILTDEIKDKAVSLIEARTGIDEWEGADVKKRIAVMDKLLLQLNSPQPAMKIPKAKIPKAKHKPGDVIIIRTCSKDYEYAPTVYNKEICCDSNYIYPHEIADKLLNKIRPPYEAYDKYIAILCVGTEKIKYSQYVDGVYGEHSVYAFYDYINDKKPSVDDLSLCGFLPQNLRYTSTYGNTVETMGWTYTFNLFAYSFKAKVNGSEQFIEKTVCPSECERFWRLFAVKKYLNVPAFQFELFHAFSDFFEEKVRLTLAGISYDNLLDADAVNPPLLTAEEISENIKKSQKEWEEKVEKLESSEAYQNADDKERAVMLRALLTEDDD